MRMRTSWTRVGLQSSLLCVEIVPPIYISLSNFQIWIASCTSPAHLVRRWVTPKETWCFRLKLSPITCRFIYSSSYAPAAPSFPSVIHPRPNINVGTFLARLANYIVHYMLVDKTIANSSFPRSDLFVDCALTAVSRMPAQPLYIVPTPFHKQSVLTSVS